MMLGLLTYLCCVGATRLIMNNDLDKGSQIPYIERAVREGFEVVVLNTNLNKFPDLPRDSPGVNIVKVPVYDSAY